MSIHFISGKPGGGKSMHAVRIVLDELKKGKRCVVTNLPLKIADLNIYAPDCNAVARVRILEETELARFYMHRGWCIETGQNEDLEERCRDGILQLTAPSAGVLYVLDEAHLCFNSREWAKLGKGCLWYLSQHRKFGDDVLVVTQHCDNVDKQFRVLAQDFTYCTNLSKVRSLGFRGPDSFLLRTFGSWPMAAGSEQAVSSFRLDVVGLGSLYDTACGVGLLERANAPADTKARKRGPSWRVLVGAAGVVMVAAYFAVSFAGGWFAAAFLPKSARPAAPLSLAPVPFPVESGVPALAPPVPSAPARLELFRADGYAGPESGSGGRALVQGVWCAVQFVRSWVEWHRGRAFRWSGLRCPSPYSCGSSS
jgi:hypothetical protein